MAGLAGPQVGVADGQWEPARVTPREAEARIREVERPRLVRSNTALATRHLVESASPRPGPRAAVVRKIAGAPGL